MSLKKVNHREAFDKLIHDIKNPIGRIRTRLEMALESEPDISEYQEAMSYCYEATERALKLMNVLADLYRAQLGELKFTNFSLTNLIKDVLIPYELAIEEKKIKLIIELDNGVELSGDLELIKALMASLVDNSVSYCMENDKIQINLKKDSNSIVFSIIDSGIGITSDELPHVTSRMYRGTKARELNLQGLGMGLTLAKEVVLAHGGEINTQSPVENQKGTKVEIQFH